MKPKTDPAADSLISGMGIPGQVPQPQYPIPTTPSLDPQIPSVQNPGGNNFTAQSTQPFVSASPYVPEAAVINPFQANSLSQPSVPPISPNPLSNNPFQNPQQPADVFQNQVINPSPQPVTSQIQQDVQATSPLDTPPAPPSQPPVIQSQVNLGSTVMEEKPKKKLPVFLILLLLLVVIVLGVVGFLAYQNFNLSKNITPAPVQTPLSKPPVETDIYSGYISYKSKILPVEFMIPSDWKAEETQEKDLANQKMININSSDFTYDSGAISKGYQFRVGPVNDLTKKYDSFDAFSAEENSGNLYSQKTINGAVWLIKGNEAKTLTNGTPLTVALYSSTDLASTATDFFNKILNSVKITQTAANVTPVVTIKPASPSATPIE